MIIISIIHVVSRDKPESAQPSNLCTQEIDNMVTKGRVCYRGLAVKNAYHTAEISSWGEQQPVRSTCLVCIMNVE